MSSTQVAHRVRPATKVLSTKLHEMGRKAGGRIQGIWDKEKGRLRRIFQNNHPEPTALPLLVRGGELWGASRRSIGPAFNFFTSSSRRGWEPLKNWRRGRAENGMNGNPEIGSSFSTGYRLPSTVYRFPFSSLTVSALLRMIGCFSPAARETRGAPALRRGADLPLFLPPGAVHAFIYQ